MATIFKINSQHIDNLDLSPVQDVVEGWGPGETLKTQASDCQFEIEYPLVGAQDCELPEIPEIRLWFIRLDTYYPWLLFYLDRSSGELIRYAAMLLPHEFSQKEGIQFNPQALDIFVMQKIFVISNWMRQVQLSGEGKLRQMVECFGYELDSTLFKLL